MFTDLVGGCQVGVVKHEKCFGLYFLRFVSLGCALLVKLLFPLQGVPFDAQESNSHGYVSFRFPWFLVSLLLSLWVSGVVVFAVVLWSPKKSAKRRTAPGWL